jgi:hypothetical protein
MPSAAQNAIFQIGAFNARVVRELEGLPEPARHLGTIEAAESESEEGIRIHAGPVEAARLMQTIVSCHRFEAALNEVNGHWHIDVRAGKGVTRGIIDLVVSAIDRDRLSFATVCIGKRTLSFYPLRADHSPALAA